MIFKVIDLILGSFFIVGILTIRMSISGNIWLIVGFWLCKIILISVPVIVLVIYCFDFKRRLHKPTDLEWDNLLKKKCCHITYKKCLHKIDKGANNVYLKSTKSFIANAAALCRSSVYFFIGEPTIEQLRRNDINLDRNYAIYVDIKDLDRSRVRIRQYDNVLVYLGPYKGKGTLTKYIRDDRQYKY